MGTFCILHLSDLHISSKTISSTNRKLIEDISKQTAANRKIILIVSGDIINRGDYKCVDGVIKFFEALYDILKLKVSNIYIVPGNHDKSKTNSSNIYSQFSQSSDLEIDDKSYWELQNDNYFEYFNMINKIYEIFKKKEVSSNTFGVEYSKIDNKIVAIIKLDTSWGTNAGNNERKKLIIGKYQREALLKDYKSLKENLENKNEAIDLTIAVGHHPLNWLKPLEEEWIKKYLIDDELFNVDIFMCGHIHDMDIENWYNHEHSVMTLVTGIGWNHHNENESQMDRKDNHRYSLYFIDIDKNTCEIVVRKTQLNGKFDCDYSIYSYDKEKTGKKLCYPIKISENIYPLLQLNAPLEEDVQYLSINDNILNNIQKISTGIVKFYKNCLRILERYKIEYLQRIEDFYDLDSYEYNETFKILYDHFFDSKDALLKDDDIIFQKAPDITFELFAAFLQDISNYFVELFKNEFEEGTNLNVHFRWYNEKNDSYCQLCKSSSIEENTDPKLSDIRWGGMIEEAFKLGKPLVYSVNEKYCNEEPLKWDDFLIIVPQFLNYVYEKRIPNAFIKRPIISFSVAVMNNSNNKKKLSEILYILEYLNIDTYISDILDEFMSVFSVDSQDYLNYLKINYMNNEIGKGEYND